MERIQYLPLDSSPKGKNYIFFAAHPEDMTQYFEPLRKEIIRIEENCAFWFDADPTQPWDDSLTNMLTETGIQMFLFPVTEKLLRTENNAITKLLPYALQENIPMIPVLLEPGLESLYEKTFGDLQYMDKVTVDHTAIPYEEKLKRFLQDILISRETAEKIRAAFDAYIFLSYRKKDRALAAKLMKLIHEIPQMRDVAIWYDEFLVPGENFNTNIAEALEKSDLFTMAVTPNLVNEENYVHSTEYPKADKAGKPIVPIQVEDTDPVAFRSFFEKLAGSSIDAYNGKALEKALLEAFGKLRHITLAQNDDPMHTYLIGLAYLNGIDVEREYDRALKLITAAAEGNCLEAMEKLANIYLLGPGNQRNDALSLHWQQEATNSWREKCRNSTAVEDRLQFADSLQQLAMRMQSLERIDAAIEFYEEAAKEYQFCIQDAEYAQAARESLLATESILITAYLRKSNDDRARTAAYKIIDQLSSSPLEKLTIAQRNKLALACCVAAQAEEKLGNTPAAADLHQQALDICENEVGRQHMQATSISTHLSCYRRAISEAQGLLV